MSSESCIVSAHMQATEEFPTDLLPRPPGVLRRPTSRPHGLSSSHVLIANRVWSLNCRYMIAEEADSILLDCLDVRLAHNVYDRRSHRGMGLIDCVAVEVCRSPRAGVDRCHSSAICFSLDNRQERPSIPAVAAGSWPSMCMGYILLLAAARHTELDYSPAGWAHTVRYCLVADYTCYCCCCSNCRPY
jgi:hypothetical protein